MCPMIVSVIVDAGGSTGKDLKIQAGCRCSQYFIAKLQLPVFLDRR